MTVYMMGPDGGFDWSAFLASGIGAVAALLGVCLASHFSKRLAEEARRATVIGGVKALWAEMSVNFVRYEVILAEDIRSLKPNEYLTVNWPINSDYFSVYAANAGLLGELRDDKLAAEIIEAVSAAKGLVDSLRLNLEMVERLNALQERSALNRNEAGLTFRINELEAHLITYASGFKSLDQRLTALMNDISPRIAALK